MTRIYALAGLLLVAGTQAARGQGVTVPTTLTGEQQAALEAIRDLRDSVVAANSLLAGLTRDINQKPASALEEQARRIAAQCSVAERQRVSSRTKLAAQRFPGADATSGQKRMIANMDRLKQPLAACGTTYLPLSKPGKGEEMRGYGISRSKPVVAGFTDFEKSVVALSKEMQLPVRDVLRAGPSPVPGQIQAAPQPAS
jgi:hypothetical protein